MYDYKTLAIAEARQEWASRMICYVRGQNLSSEARTLKMAG